MPTYQVPLSTQRATTRTAISMAAIDEISESKMKEYFRILDTHIYGYIPYDEFHSIIKGFQMEAALTDEEVVTLLDVVDNNKDGKITFNEFYKFMCAD